MDLKSAVSEYKRTHRTRAASELRAFKDDETDVAAVSRAARACRPDGKRYGHQRRNPRRALAECETRLVPMTSRLRASTSFDALFAMVESTISPIPGIGEVAVYDAAVRIGARFGLEPARVYLHAGTRVGARRLGLDATKKALDVADLPRELRTISAREAEDVLCIYKDRFGAADDGAPPRGCGQASTKRTCS